MMGVILVSGVPGAGKSSLAAALAARLERGVHVEADALQTMIKNAARWPGEEPIEEGFRQLRLRGRNACLLADSFAQAGFVPVVDDIIVGSRLAEYRGDLQSRPIHFVMLAPSLDALRRRNAEREKVDVFHQAEELDPVVRGETLRTGLWLDTSDERLEQTVERVLARLDEARIP